MVFSSQERSNHTNPRNFEAKDLPQVREIAKGYNAQIVEITTTTVRVQERKIIE